jgi:predicted component of type VI protein secretion system
MVYIRIKVQVDLQVDKSSVVVKGPFFPQVSTQGIKSVEQMCDARTNLIKLRTLIFKGESYASNLENIMKMNLIYENRR